MAKRKLPPLKLNTKVITLGELQAYANNPRVNEGGVEPLKESIKGHKYQQPIIVTKDNVIVAGHTRLKAIKKLGYKDTDEIEVQVYDGTEEEAKAFRLIDNKTGEFSGWDFEMLDEERASISLNLDTWFPALEVDEFEEVPYEEDSDEYIDTTTPSEPKEKKHMVCPHCGQVIEL